MADTHTCIHTSYIIHTYIHTYIRLHTYTLTYIRTFLRLTCIVRLTFSQSIIISYSFIQGSTSPRTIESILLFFFHKETVGEFPARSGKLLPRSRVRATSVLTSKRTLTVSATVYVLFSSLQISTVIKSQNRNLSEVALLATTIRHCGTKISYLVCTWLREQVVRVIETFALVLFMFSVLQFGVLPNGR